MAHLPGAGFTGEESSAASQPSGLPVIDLSPDQSPQEIARQLSEACESNGFFYIKNHGVSTALLDSLELVSEEFFSMAEEEKLKIRMELAGPAWRGYFPVGGELTSGKPDLKEGLYFGEERAANDPLVRAGTPLHGPNLFPAAVPAMRQAVLQYMEEMTGLGHRLMGFLALGLGLEENYFQSRYTARPFVLFRIFHYPAEDPALARDGWGVGPHTDYGMLTILKQDDVGGLEVRTPQGWEPAPPVPGTFVCNIGDMLEKLTGGRYVSTLHRVRNSSGRSRFSYPFFFDPDFFARLEALPAAAVVGNGGVRRWDGKDPHLFSGTYGEYLLEKVGHVFPELKTSVIDR